MFKNKQDSAEAEKESSSTEKMIAAMRGVPPANTSFEVERQSVEPRSKGRGYKPEKEPTISEVTIIPSEVHHEKYDIERDRFYSGPSIDEQVREKQDNRLKYDGDSITCEIGQASKP